MKKGTIYSDDMEIAAIIAEAAEVVHGIPFRRRWRPRWILERMFRRSLR